MKKTMMLALLLVVLFGLSVHCSTGEEPEVVVVPVGEPGGDDPYDDGGDLGCGAGPVNAMLFDEDEQGDEMVLVTFAGTTEAWLVYVTRGEFEQLAVLLLDALDEAEEISRGDVDTFHAQFCEA